MDNKDVLAAMKIAENTNYLNKNYTYLKNVRITEWDIHSAGLSVIKFRKLLPEAEIQHLESLNKHQRTVREGLIQRKNPSIAKQIVKTLSKAVQAFVCLNQIKPGQILSIKKDALFVINSQIKNKIVKEAFEFRNKNSYTSYLYSGRIEFYYDSVRDLLDIKGISDDNFKNSPIANDVKRFLRSGEKVDKSVMFQLLKTYQANYLNRKLPIETYRELKTGKYRIGEFLFDEVPESELPNLDISQNYMIIILPIIQAMI